MTVSSSLADRAAAMARGYTIEATRPKPDEIAAVAAIVGRGRQLYLSAVPAQTLDQLAALAAATRRAGLEPVVHLPARRLTGKVELENFLARLRGDADVRCLLVIAGDIDQAGPFADALEVIRGGRLREAGIEEVGIAGYPDGHAHISSDRIDAALTSKMSAAAEAGLRLHIVSQFAFDPEPIIAWLKRLRAREIAVPVRIGMAGPTGLTTLLRYARRCGVNASMRGIMSGAATGLLGNVGPDKIVTALLGEKSDLGGMTLHYFSFGGVEQTARYAHDMAMRWTARQAAIS